MAPWRMTAFSIALALGSCTGSSGPNGTEAASSVEATGPHSGVRGVVVVASACITGDPLTCTPDFIGGPERATLRITKPSGERITKLKVGPSGRFDIALPPGRYVIEAE